MIFLNFSFLIIFFNSFYSVVRPGSMRRRGRYCERSLGLDRGVAGALPAGLSRQQRGGSSSSSIIVASAAAAAAARSIGQRQLSQG